MSETLTDALSDVSYGYVQVVIVVNETVFRVGTSVKMSGMFMGFVSLFITAFGVSQVGNLHRYYVDRSKE